MLTALFAVFTSCEDEPVDEELLISSENLASNFQVDFDNQTYVAEIKYAKISGGKITISGYKGETEFITLEVAGDALGTYALGKEENGKLSTAIYSQPTKTGNLKWSTIGSENKLQGNVFIENIDVENQTISGKFRFTGKTADGITKEFTNGVFEKIKYTGETNGGSENVNKFSASVDGETFSPDKIKGELKDLSLVKGIEITASVDKKETITLLFPIDAAVGTGTFTSELEAPTALYTSASGGNFTGKAGDYVIEIHDLKGRRIKGIFKFTGKDDGGTDTKDIKSGVFDIYYK